MLCSTGRNLSPTSESILMSELRLYEIANNFKTISSQTDYKKQLVVWSKTTSASKHLPKRRQEVALRYSVLTCNQVPGCYNCLIFWTSLQNNQECGIERNELKCRKLHITATQSKIKLGSPPLLAFPPSSLSWKLAIVLNSGDLLLGLTESQNSTVWEAT